MLRLHISVAVAGMVVFILATFGSGQETRKGKVVGSMFDPNDAVILGTKLTISRPGFEKSVMPDPMTGEFTFEVEPGTYAVTSSGKVWFPIRRALFAVKENQTIVINLRPTLRLRSLALEVTSKGSRDLPTYNLAPKYQEFLPFLDSPLNVVIEYREKLQKGSVIEYKNVKLSYDSYAVCADALSFNTKDLSFEATFNVTSDENGVRKKTDRLVSTITRK